MTSAEIKKKRLELEEAINKKTIELRDSRLYKEKVLLKEELIKLQSDCEHPELTMTRDRGYECSDCGEYIAGEYGSAEFSIEELENWKGKRKN